MKDRKTNSNTNIQLTIISTTNLRKIIYLDFIDAAFIYKQKGLL